MVAARRKRLSLADVQERDRYGVILAPPFGGKERPEMQQNFLTKTGKTAFLFLQYFIKRLCAGGQAAAIKSTRQSACTARRRAAFPARQRRRSVKPCTHQQASRRTSAGTGW